MAHQVGGSSEPGECNGLHHPSQPARLQAGPPGRSDRTGLSWLVAAVAALGYSVVDYDSTPAPAAVDFPTVDEMRAENMEIRRQIAVANAAAEAPAAEDPVIRPTKEQP